MSASPTKAIPKNYSKYEQIVNDIVSGVRANYFTAIIGNFDAFDPKEILHGIRMKIHDNIPGQDGMSWRPVQIRPGLSPFENLATALSQPDVLVPKGHVDVNFRKEIYKELKSGSSGLINLHKRIKKLHNTPFNLLLIIDHFEDLFRLWPTAAPAEKRGEDLEFVNLLMKAGVWEKVPIYIILVLPSEIVEKSSRYRGLSKAIQEGSFFLKKPSKEDYKNLVKYHLKSADEALVNAINHDLNFFREDKDLDFKWNFLVRQLKDRGAQLENYIQLGGLLNVIGTVAEQIYQNFTPKQQKICERIFMYSSEMASQNHAIPKPMLLSKLVSLNNRPGEASATVEEIDFVLSKFTNKKVGLMEKIEPTLSAKSQTLSPSNTLIRPTGAAVLNSWPRAIEWIKKESLSEYIYQNLVKEALQNRGRTKEGTSLAESDLNLVLKLFKEEKPNEEWASLYYPLEKPAEEWAQNYKNTFHIATHYLQISKERSEREKAHKEAHRKKMARLYKRSAILMALVAVISFIFLGVSMYQSNEVKRERENLTQLNFIDLLVQHYLIEEISFDDRLQIMNDRDIRKIHDVLDHFETEGILSNAERNNEDITNAFHSIAELYVALKSERGKDGNLGEREKMIMKSAKKLIEQIENSSDKENNFYYLALHAYFNKLLDIHKIKGETRMSYESGYIAFASNPVYHKQFAFADKFGEILVINRRNSRDGFKSLKMNDIIRKVDIDEPVKTLEYSKDGTALFAGTFSGKVFQWNFEERRRKDALIQHELEHQSKIYHIKLVGDNRFFLGHKTQVRGPGKNNFYEFTKDSLTSLIEIASMALSDNNRYLLVGGTNNTLVFKLDARFKLRNPTIIQHKSIINKVMDTFESHVAIGSDKGQIVIFDLNHTALNQPTVDLEDIKITGIIDSLRHEDATISGLQFFRDTTDRQIHLATCAADGLVKLWDLGQDIRTFSKVDPLVLNGHKGTAWDVVFNNEGELLSMGDNYIYFWETNVMNMRKEVDYILSILE